MEPRLRVAMAPRVPIIAKCAVMDPGNSHTLFGVTGERYISSPRCARSGALCVTSPRLDEGSASGTSRRGFWPQHPDSTYSFADARLVVYAGAQPLA